MPSLLRDKMIIRRGLRWLRRRLWAPLTDRTGHAKLQSAALEPHTQPVSPGRLTASWSLQTLLARRPEPAPGPSAAAAGHCQAGMARLGDTEPAGASVTVPAGPGARVHGGI